MPAATIKTNGDLANAYLQSQQKLSVCIVENQALKKCIDEFNKQEKQWPINLTVRKNSNK